MGPSATRLLAAALATLAATSCNCSQKLVGVDADLTISPAELDFGGRLAGTAHALPVEVRNRGRVAATIAGLRFEANARGAFSTAATPFTLAPGDAFQLTVSYAAPAQPGQDTGTLLLTTGSGAELAVALQGQSVLTCEPSTCTSSCVPQTCGAACGPTLDGCGQTLDCPPCPAPDAGSAAPDAGAPDAGCTPRSCQAAGASCGSVPDGCGGSLGCGACTNGATCAANQCTCAAGAAEACGDGKDNNCDGNVDCADPQCAALAACAQPACSVADPEVQLTSSGGQMSAILWTGSSYGVFFTDPTLRYGFARLDSSFALAQPATLTAVTQPAHRPFPVWSGTEFGMGWSDVRNGALQYSNEVFFNRFDAATGAALASNDTPISTGPGLAFPGMTGFNPSANEYGVLYADEGPANTSGSQRRLYFQRVSAAGAKVGTPQRISPAGLTDGTADYGGLAWAGSTWGAVWTESRNGQGLQVYFSRLDATGAPVGQETHVSAGATYGAFPRIASSGSAFGVVYFDERSAAPGRGIYFQRFDAQGAGASTPRLVTPIAGSGTSAFSYPDIAWAGTHWAVVFDDSRSGLRRTYFAKLDVDGNRVGPDQLLSCQLLATWAPTVAFDGQRLAVAFSYWLNGSGNVWAKRFAP